MTAPDAGTFAHEFQRLLPGRRPEERVWTRRPRTAAWSSGPRVDSDFEPVPGSRWRLQNA